MARRSKKSFLLIIIQLILFLVASLIYINFYSESKSNRNLNSAQYYENIVLDSFIKTRYWLKKVNEEHQVNDDITIIGIDDKTQEWFGKFGNATWSARIPYDANLQYLQRYFPPQLLAFDIMFKSDSGVFQSEHDLRNISADPEKLKVLIKQLKVYSEELDRIKPKTMLEMSSLIAEQGEYLMAFALGNLQSPPPSEVKLPEVPVISAYNLEEQEAYYNFPVSKFQSEDYYTWSFEELYGDDPEYPDEELGTALPYLQENAVDIKKVFDVPEDYTFLPKASLISPNFIDMVDLAFINVRRDEDGIVRRAPLVLGTKYKSLKDKKLNEIFLPSMALKVCMTSLGLSNENVEVYFGKYVQLKSDKVDIRIPIDSHGRMRLNFDSNAFDFNYVSFKDINEFGMALSTKGEKAFKGNFKNKLQQLRESLNGKICLVGLTATGNSDSGPTSLSPNTSYVYAHATAINSILNQSFLIPASDKRTLLVLFFAFVLVSIFGTQIRLRYFAISIVFVLGIILSYCFFSMYFSINYYPTLYLITTVLVSSSIILLVRYFTEEKEKALIRKMFSTMVSEDVLTYMDENPESFSLSGQRAHATMMFSDVAGFTSISEGLSPEKLVLLLNKYLNPMTEIIMGHNGYIDKYEGDAIMAEWGVPYPNEKHATLACYSCLDQLAKLDEIREELFTEFGYEIYIRLGVNSGFVSAGNMGSTDRFSYTVMGDAVNLAARLEPTNKIYGTDVMIGETTYDLAKEDIDARLLDKVVVVGKKEAIRVYELLARKGELSDSKKKFVLHYEKGLQLHEERLWDEAIEEFEAALKIEPEDTASQVMIGRNKEYKQNPPGESWQGEYVRKSKD